MKLKSYLALTLMAVGILTSCSILRKDDPEKNVRTYLASFQADLVKTDDEILSRFRVKQTREAILSVINILQNKDPFIVCDVAMESAVITFEKELVKVEVPITFRVKDIDSEDSEPFTLQLWLTADKQDYTITQFDGEGLYQTFTNIKNRNEWKAEQKLSMQERLWIYENARKLEEKFDSVIWYATYREQNYFYVVDGSWTNYFFAYDTRYLKNTGIHMGLVDAKGETIIPIEYDLIGAIGFEEFNLVEVTKEGKVGYFDLGTKQLAVEPKFDLIIPYGRENVWAVVKQDTVYGWLDDQFMYRSGFPSSRVKDWVDKFEFLKENVRLKAGEHNFCEIPSPDQIGNGIIVPPSYLSRHGIFDEIEGGISTTKVPMNGWTEYKETTGSFFETISDNIRAVVTTMKERYLEGREEFYTSSQLVFVNQHHDTLQVASISGAEISMHTIDSTLVEVRTPQDYWFGEYAASDENNLYSHSYFAISGNKEIIPLTSNRLFPQTQFVKLDSSYLKGLFMVYNHTTEKNEPTTFLSARTITYMRDEILASYGYTFPENEKTEHFQQIGKWYLPRHSRIEDFEEEMTEIDQFNLAFLNKVLGQMKTPLT